MDVREKLVELLQNAKSAMKSENLSCDIARNMFVVDFMMANGVTVQEWISVKDRLPEPWKRVLIYSRHDFCELASYIGIPGKWRVTWNHEMLDDDSVTHWMPLPLPPKGE